MPRKAVRNGRAGRGDSSCCVSILFDIAMHISSADALLQRKSEYCDDYMYWVAVRLKGSNKCHGYNLCVESFIYL